MKTKSKQKQMSKEEYIATFCNEKRIRNRWAVYVSPETHTQLQKAVFTFTDHYVTAMSIVDAILSHHFKSNKELLSRLYNEELGKVMNFKKYNNKPDSMDDESDEEIPPSIVDGDNETACP